jgi:hypothetical protein
MGGILGGGGGGSGGGLLGGGGGGGFLGNLLGGLPDPLGLGKMLGITGQEEEKPMGQMGPQQPQGPSGVQFAPPAGSGVSQGAGQMLNSPMGPTGFRVGGGGQ